MHTALRATSITLQELLRAGISADPELGPLFDQILGGTMVVSLNTPKEMQDANVQGLSFWLYRVERDDQRLNDPPARITATRLAPTPLPLRLHYLATPIVTIDPAFAQVSPAREQEILGKVLQLLYGHPVLRGADLRDALTGNAGQMAVRLEAMAHEDITRVWQSLQRPYQLSVSYEVTLAAIAPESQPSVVVPVQIAAPAYYVVVDEGAP